MGTTEIGALIVSLRSESAEFRAEMDRARTSLKNVGGQSELASRQIAKLAADGFGAVLPISFRAEQGIERFIEKSLKAQGALGLLAKSTLVVGAGFAAFKLGQTISEFAALGTTVERYDENIRKASEEQRKFLDGIAKQSAGLRSLKAELAAVRGDELSRIAAAGEDRADAIRQRTRGNPEARARQLAENDQIQLEARDKFFAEQTRLRNENEKRVFESLTRERDEQLKAWQTETAFLGDELKTRLKLRQDFEAQLGQGGIGGGDTSARGIASVRRLRDQLQKEARDLAFQERQGLISQSDSVGARESIRTRALEEARRLREEFAAYPAVLAAIDRAVQSVEFGNFGLEIAKARVELEKIAPATSALQTGLGEVGAQLAALPSAADPASRAIVQLTATYRELAAAVRDVARAQSELTGGE